MKFYPQPQLFKVFSLFFHNKSKKAKTSNANSPELAFDVFSSGLTQQLS